MRVISGRKASRKLLAPRDSGITRPTTDRVKESVFMYLSNNGYIDQAVVLDLFAGSGALGIEALSRGALRSYFVDNNQEAAKVTQANIETLDLHSYAIIRKQDYKHFLKNVVQKFDLIFIDPPYNMDDYEVLRILERIEEKDMLNSEGLIVIERGRRTLIDKMAGNLTKYAPIHQKLYSETNIIYIAPR